MLEDESERTKCPSGLPPWMATFADMMTLLLCFFVLLSSTSVQDAKKYKAIVESMRKAFNASGFIFVDDATSSTPVMVKEIPQVQIKPPAKNEVKNANENLEQMKARVMNAALLEVRDQAEKIKRHLQTEIQDGFVTVETHGLQITLRIEEKGSFTSGSAVLKPGFESVMDKITDSLQRAKGIIRVAGHTDDIPITTDSYRSNWELSSSRAVSVAHYMLTHKGLEPGRIAIEGYADTKPLLPNTSTENRAKNRRVEVTLIQDDPTLALERKKLLGAD